MIKIQINRLFETVYILLDKKRVTARELAEHFGVSQRTIYRDIETLSSAGIPIYMSKGRGGGISLLENFVLNKSMLSESEQTDVLSALQGLSSLNLPEAKSTVTKLGTLFNKDATSWIDIDFSYWGSDSIEKNKFGVIKNAILLRKIITFDYYSVKSEKSFRTVEPLQIYFKEKSWYLKSFCITRQDYRIFKITRIKNITITDKSFVRELPKDSGEDFSLMDKTDIVLRFFPPAFSRIYDELEELSFIKKDSAEIVATISCPEDEWVYGYILSYGNDVEVLEPKHIRQIIKHRLEKSLERYND